MLLLHQRFVALLAEGVDRNNAKYDRLILSIRGSPSSRRAWIEIPCPCTGSGGRESPSSRRAWIEIFNSQFFVYCAIVALLAEGVDRNIEGYSALSAESGSPSSRRAWIEIRPSLPKNPLLLLPVALLTEGVDRNAL